MKHILKHLTPKILQSQMKAFLDPKKHNVRKKICSATETLYFEVDKTNN